jgi:hypothetical protein
MITAARFKLYDEVTMDLSDSHRHLFAIALWRLDQYTADVLEFLWDPLIIVGCSTQVHCIEQRISMRRLSALLNPDCT